MRDNDIKQAFERMTPDADTRARMLAHILIAADKQREQVSPQQTPKKKPPAWAVALPLAACLVLLVGVGLLIGDILPFGGFGLNKSIVHYENAAGTANDRGTSADAEDTGTRENSQQNESEALTLEDAESAPADSVMSAPDAAENFPERYPLLESDRLGRLYLIDEGTSIVDPARVGAEIESARAKSADGTTSISCTLYEYTESDVAYYAVLYEGDTTYYLASPLTR